MFIHINIYDNLLIDKNVNLIDFSYYQLRLQKCDSGDIFTIHGLWPEYDNSTWPSYCKNITYDKQLIPQDMDKYWYSCKGDSNSFWKHEWIKHGVCTDYTQLEYFTVVLDLYLDLNISDECNNLYNKCSIYYYKNLTKI